MKSDASPIEDAGRKPAKKQLPYPVWPGHSASGRAAVEKALLLLEKSEHETSMQDDASSIEHIEPKPTKEKLPYPVWNEPPATKKKIPILKKPSYQASAKKITAGISSGVPSKERQVRQQVAHDKGPKESLGKISDCAILLNICRQAAAKAVATEDETDRNVVEVLAGILALKQLVSTNPAAEKDLNQAYKAARIRITGRTANPYTPMMKLVFPKKAQTPATISRRANAALFADQAGIKPDGFIDFVRQNGGVAACASHAAEKRRNAAGGSSSTATAVEEFVAARRRNAARINLPDGLGLPKQGPSVLLVEPASKGGWSLLAWCEASPTMVRRFSQGKARPSAPAGRKRR